ncbi:NUDIX hydrolase [Actinoplanes couchii]|nr:NUDIX domain-containing protein [Actinoplanes couchii]
MLTGVPCRDEPPRRHSARALIVTPDHRILLCRHLLPDPPGQVVWAAPGGGLEPGEMPLTALRRELAEEVGLTVETDPPYVWRQEFATTANDYFLIRTDKFRPHGALSDTELAAENITELRWWPLRDIATYRGPDLFSPRDLATPLSELLRKGAPPTPTVLGM